jgi:MFS family permease
LPQPSSDDRRTLRRNLKEMPGAAWFMTVGVFVNRFGSFVILFLALYLTRQLHFSATQAGTAVAAYGVGEVLAGGIGGDLADRIGRRNTITVSMLGSAAALIGLSQASSFRAIVTLAFVVGLMSEMYRPASAALASDLVPEGARVTIFAVLRLASNLGFAAGSALAGFFADHSFLWLFLADAASSALFAIITVLALPADSGHRADEGESPKPGYRALLSDRAFLLLLVSAAFITFVYYQELVGVPLHVRAVGLSNADFGLLLTFNGGLVVLLELPLSAVTMRLPPRWMLALGFLLVGVGFSLTGAANTMPLLLATVAVWSAGEMIGAPVSYAYVADIAPKHMRGRYQGIFGLAWGSGAVTGPALGAFLLGHDSMLFWPLLAALGVVAAGLVLLGRASGTAVERAEATAAGDVVPGPAGEPSPQAIPSVEGPAVEPVAGSGYLVGYPTESRFRFRRKARSSRRRRG